MVEENKEEEKKEGAQEQSDEGSQEQTDQNSEQSSLEAQPDNPFEKMMKNLSKRERTIVYVTAFCLLLLSLDKIVLSPILNRIKTLEEDIRQEISIVKDGLLIIGYKDAIRTEYESLKKYFTEDRQTQEEEIADFLKDMEVLAMDSGVYLVTVNPSGNVVSSREYTIYEINLNCRGTMETIMTFLYKLSMNNKPTKVVSCELVPPGRSGGEVQCNMLISRMFTTI